MYIYNECVKTMLKILVVNLFRCFKCINCVFNILFILKEKNGYCFVVDEVRDL